MIKPTPLQKGDTIGIAAPASPFDRAEFEKGIQALTHLGFRTKYREDLFSTQRYLAGSDARRSTELLQHFADPEVKAIFFARGGYGTARLLPYLSDASLKPYPKIVMGYSDMTTLLLHLHQRFSWVVFHGPVVAKGMGDGFGERGRKSLLRALCNPEPLGEIRDDSILYLKEGKARGILVGGCLSILVTDLKTPEELNTAGKILFLEDVNEKPYAIDRMLTHLKRAGKFEKTKGLVFGPFQNSGHSPEEVKAVIEDVLEDLKIPIVFGFPSGHMDDMMTIPFGVEVELDSTQGSVRFVEGALQA
ncbi:MAG: LD-carboxypeptidase [bacterium]